MTINEKKKREEKKRKDKDMQRSKIRKPRVAGGGGIRGDI